MTPGTDAKRVRVVGLPRSLTLNRYSDVRHAAVRAAATNARPSPVATPVSSVARNGSLIVAPRVPVVALTTTMDGCRDQFSATKKAGVVAALPLRPCGGPPRGRRARQQNGRADRHRGHGGGRGERDQQPAPGPPAPGTPGAGRVIVAQAADPLREHRLGPDRLRGGAVGIAQPVFHRVHGSSFSARG